MNVAAAMQRWVEVWQRAWRAKDVEAIVHLYATDATYLSFPFRDPDRGHEGVRAYLSRNFAVEDEIECWFGEPVIGDGRAAVEWWGTWVENAETLTLAGATVLRFDADGLVVDHRDYWNQWDERRPPYPGW